MACVPFTYTQIEDRLFIGSIPNQPEHCDQLVALGVTDVLSLTRRHPMTYENMSQWRGPLVWYRAPIADNGIGSDELMLDAARFVKDIVKQQWASMYVHCRGGIGRSGTILIAYYVLHRGMSIEQARDTVRPRRNYEGNACAADQGSPQREWIDNLESLRAKK